MEIYHYQLFRTCQYNRYPKNPQCVRNLKQKAIALLSTREAEKNEITFVTLNSVPTREGHRPCSMDLFQKLWPLIFIT